MEGIVNGIAHINFYTNLSKTTDENSAPNTRQQSSNMSVHQIPFLNSDNPEPVGLGDSSSFDILRRENADEAEKQSGEAGSLALATGSQLTILPSTSAVQALCNIINEENHNQSPFLSREVRDDEINDSGWEEVDDFEDRRKNKKGFTLAERRQMPSRASKETSLLKIKRRTIMKPAKHVKTCEEFKNLKPSEIKKIYLNKKLVNFKPSSLETIFEEEINSHNDEDDSNQVMGSRKIKRSIKLSDGFQYSKTLVNKRRAKIKKTIGKRFALKKIPLEEFITKLNTSIEKDKSDEDKDCCMNDHRNVMTEESPSNGVVSNTSQNFDETTNTSMTNLFCSSDNTMSP